MKPRSVTAKTPEAAAAIIIERDLSILTGPELARKYSDLASPAGQMFWKVTGANVSEFTSHNPFWHYTLATWFDNPDGRAMLSSGHRVLADDLLNLALGKYDAKDGYVCGQPRRSLKSTFLRAFADWVPKRHKLVDGLDVILFYVHNQHDEAKNATEAIKNKNRFHPYIAKHFGTPPYNFRIPQGEYGTKEQWDWPCRREGDSVSDPQVRAMPIRGKKAGKGAHYRLLDDCEDEDSRSSEIIRKQIGEDYDQLRQLEAPAFSREAFIDTPYHLYGLTLNLKDAKRESTGESRYQVRWVPALKEDDTPNFPNIRKLTVEGLAKERANEMSRTGSDAFFYLQYLLDPRKTGTQAMRWEWFQPMGVMEHRVKWARLPHFRCVFVDSAWKGTEKQAKGDSTAIEVIDIYNLTTPDGGERMVRILLDTTVSRELVSDEGAHEMIRLMKKWGTRHYCIEQTAEKTFEGTMRAVAKSIRPVFWTMPAIDLKGWTKKRKMDRISAVAGGARDGTVYYLETIQQKDIEILKREVADYPENKTSPNMLDCFANSFSDAVIRSWVPMAEDIPDYLKSPEPASIPISRYTGLNAYVQ